MTDVDVITLLRESLFITMKVSSPILLVALVVGLFIGILQTTTSIQEPTIAFVPKLFAIFIVIVIFAAWIVRVMMDYTTIMFMMIEKI
ncbi:MAG: flagellar biosynthetic protein FliQ [Leptospiraceae bacterium]|nr:flagellar biosynthetic protein FliQ [Leptospiraceae bacterium]MCP5499557.1 flagellar biosynthetic protein FliQ [Leptospiraceae bacterium]